MLNVVNQTLLPTCFVPKYVACIDYLADKLFISSFILNKLKDFPIGVLAPICTNLALLCLALAYTLQIFSSPHYQPQPYSSRALAFNVLGCLTAWTCIIFPEIWLICTWLFFLNNLIWLYNEQSRLSTPSTYPQMPKNQLAYCHYVACIVCATLISALTNTLDLALIGRILNWVSTALGLYFLWEAGQEQTQSISSLAC